MPVRVLLADDHQIVRQGVRALLEREGFDVVGEAADGREAVRLAEHLRPDVAILDLAMPSLNGVNAAKEIFLVSPRTRTPRWRPRRLQRPLKPMTRLTSTVLKRTN